MNQHLILALLSVLMATGTALAGSTSPATTAPKPPAVREADGDGDGFVIAEAIAVEDAASPRARELVRKAAAGDVSIASVPMSVSGVKTITCKGSYDYPHAGKSSARKKVNAHLIVTCRGTVAIDAQYTQITGSSRMLDLTDGRIGAVTTKTARGSLRVGGDLACLGGDTQVSGSRHGLDPVSARVHARIQQDRGKERRAQVCTEHEHRGLRNDVNSSRPVAMPVWAKS